MPINIYKFLQILKTNNANARYFTIVLFANVSFHEMSDLNYLLKQAIHFSAELSHEFVI